MTQTIIIAVISALTSGGCFAFVQFLITRQDDRKDKKDDVKAKLENLQTSLSDIRADIDKRFKKSEKDGLRTQLLLLLLMKPEEQTEILTIAEHYFVKPPNGLGGNWYMTGLFAKWCDAHGIEPEWFNRE